jgi:hypothetical protein
MMQTRDQTELLQRIDEVQRANRAALKALEKRRERLELMARLSERIVERAVRQLRAGR